MNSTPPVFAPLQQTQCENVSIPADAHEIESRPLAGAPGSPRRHALSRLMAPLVLLLLAAAAAVLLFYGYIAWLLGRPNISPLSSDPLHAVSLAYEDVVFLSGDGSRLLEGWYIPADKPSGRAVVFSHGYGGNREEIWVPIYDLARLVHELGYSSLMFDYGYVSGSGRPVTWGVKEKHDLLGAVAYARERGAEHVVVWGFSMGAGTALQAALAGGAIDAMILDSTFVPEPDSLYYNLKQYADVPREPSLTILSWLSPLLNGAALHDIPYRDIMESAFSMPIFMIHGTQDERSPYEIIRGIALNQVAANELSEFWLVPDATHELIYRMKQEEYKARAADFLLRTASRAVR